jgi:hypothetical protein
MAELISQQTAENSAYVKVDEFELPKYEKGAKNLFQL